MKPSNSFPALLQAFFYERLVEQRNVSPNTVRSYRDAWRLFLQFAAARHRRAVVELTLEQLTAADVAAFLQHSERDRKVSIGTRNCRLTALRSFYGFVAEREPAAIAHCAAVLHIPLKKRATTEPLHLDTCEIDAILAQPVRTTVEGQRDHVLLSFLYNTGARIQEALDVCPEAIRFDAPTCVRLRGKGRKERICPLWPETVVLLKALLKRCPRPSNEPLFVNRYGAPLGASGVRFKLAHYVESAAHLAPSLAEKNVTPHGFRHSAAVHLLAAGAEVTVIRDWLGHVHLDTTNHYARATVETKRTVLELLDPAARITKPPRWRRDASVLAWLDSL